MNSKLISDLSVLTQIPEYIFERLSNIISKEICHKVYTEHILNEKDSIDIDLEFGILSLCIDDVGGTVSYAFKPSKQLEKYLIDTLSEQKSILIDSAESNLKKKVLNLYRELI